MKKKVTCRCKPCRKSIPCQVTVGRLQRHTRRAEAEASSDHGRYPLFPPFCPGQLLPFECSPKARCWRTLVGHVDLTSGSFVHEFTTVYSVPLIRDIVLTKTPFRVNFSFLYIVHTCTLGRLADFWIALPLCWTVESQPDVGRTRSSSETE